MRDKKGASRGRLNNKQDTKPLSETNALGPETRRAARKHKNPSPDNKNNKNNNKG